MNLAQLLVDCKNIIGPGIEVDDPGLTTWINGAYMYMVDAIVQDNPDYFVKASSTATVAGQQEYVLPANYETMVMVNIMYGGTWRRALPLNDSINDIPIISSPSGQGYTAGDPRYYLYRNLIGFEPTPTDSANLALKIWYTYTPSEMTAGTSPAFPAKYHHIIKMGVLASYLEQDGQYQAAELKWSRFEKMVEDMVEHLGANQVDEPRSITITHGQDMYMDNEFYI